MPFTVLVLFVPGSSRNVTRGSGRAARGGMLMYRCTGLFESALVRDKAGRHLSTSTGGCRLSASPRLFPYYLGLAADVAYESLARGNDAVLQRPFISDRDE